MTFWLWAVIGILVCIILALAGKIFFMRKAIKEIQTEFAERLVTETNTLIGISSHDRYIRELAASINSQLKLLHEQRHKFQQGDLELKDAVTNISHDLRTPLTAIYGYLELLQREEKTETVQRYLIMIENRIEVLKQLTEELFRYSVISSTNQYAMKQIDLRRSLEESLLSFYGVMQQNGIEPNISVTEKPVERVLDPTAVNRIFNNIISNALKYSDGDFNVCMKDNGVITFSNTAKDLTPVMAGKLFERFYTVETGRNSTGLGLSIAKLLTERMGGTITASYHDNILSITVHFPIF